MMCPLVDFVSSKISTMKTFITVPSLIKEASKLFIKNVKPEGRSLHCNVHSFHDSPIINFNS